MRWVWSIAAVLVLLLPAPRGAAQEPTPWQATDATGDVAVSVGGTSTPVLPEQGPLSFFDLVSLTIEEPDEEYLRFALRNKAGFFPGGGALGAPDVRGFTIAFRLPNSTVFGLIELTVYEVDTERPQPFIVKYARLCYATPPIPSSCPGGSIGLRGTYEGGAFVSHVPKLALLVNLGDGIVAPGALAPGLRPGDQIQEIFAATRNRPPIATTNPEVTIGDRLPDSGPAPAFVLRHGAATPDLALRVGRTTIAAGEETRVPLEVQNLAAHQRILNITGSLVAGADPAWQFSVVPRVLVAGHDSTNVTVRVRAPALRDAPLLVATVRFRADIAGEPHVFGLRYADFAAVAPLDEAHRTLYLHARGGHGLPQPIPGAHVLQFGYGDLNRGENDPTAKDTDVVTLIHQGTVTQPGFRFARMVSAHRWAPNPARWDPQEPLRGQIGIEVAAPIEATLRFTISAGDAVPAAKWEKTVSLARGPQVVPFETPWRAPRDDLEVKDEQLSFEFWMERAGADSAVYGYAFFVAQPALLPKVTRVELPITRPPAPVEDPDLPRVVVEAAEDRDAFTNPGKRHVFEVDLRNEASRAVEVDLAVVSVEGKWPVEVRPGRALKLPAHDSARIGLAVEAPPSAREGETFRFELVVNDTSSGRTLDRAAFRVTATGGVSVENDTFEERTEDVRKVRAQETAGSPGPGSALAVAAVAVVIVGRRLARRG